MVISIKKCLIVSFVIIISVVSVITFVGFTLKKTDVKLPLAGTRIAVDAGHGGMDGGAVSNTGVLEKDINLKIALNLKELLENNGAKVVMTRTRDESLHSNDKGSIKSKKRSDLLNRRNIVNNSDCDIFISIHLNYFTESQYKGAQVFYETTHPESQKLAEVIQSELITVLDEQNNRKIQKIDGSKLLFQNLKSPSVLVECGFLSNTEECKKLSDEEYQARIATVINSAIIKFILKKSA